MLGISRGDELFRLKPGEFRLKFIQVCANTPSLCLGIVKPSSGFADLRLEVADFFPGDKLLAEFLVQTG